MHALGNSPTGFGARRIATVILVYLFCTLVVATDRPLYDRHVIRRQEMNTTNTTNTTVIAPKVFIISMFAPEGGVWYDIPEFDLLAQNISVVGFSPLFPEAHCTSDGQVCQMITGESEINAASSVTSLTHSPDFDLTKTYFLIAGIAGVNPELATTGSVTFARYAVQVALQYEFDAREIPANFSTGYVPQGSLSPDEYPQEIYGTEVFEVSEGLRSVAMDLARNATLNDTADAAAYRARYKSNVAYTAGAEPPSIVGCDVATSDVYYSGNLLAEAFSNTTTLFTNSSATYCTTAQEDNATLEALLRSSLANATDFSRIIIMRTASDFDRPPPGESATSHLLYAEQGGFEPSIANIYLAGIQVVMGILNQWDHGFSQGIQPGNYIGDIFDSLGGNGMRPDFGLPSQYINSGNGRKIRRNIERTREVKGNARMRTKARAWKRSGLEEPL